jgi:hypothetical protein
MRAIEILRVHDRRTQKSTMARKKKQRKRTWVRMLLLFLLTPLTVWFVAFLLWFYWYDLNKLFAPSEASRVRTKPARQSETNENRERAPERQPEERIFEEDRRKLEEILKRRG